MKWILEDLARAFEELKRWQTWLIIGVISTFAFLAYLVGQSAFKTDAVLVFLNRAAGSCRQLSNGSIIFLFCGMLFFLFSTVLALGEFQRYFEFRQLSTHHQTAQHQTAQALRWAIFWTLAAIAIAIASLVFFNRYCR